MVKVLIVDDQVILRESIKFMIEQDIEIQVVGYAGNGQEALELCGDLNPDLVLMDIMMPVCDGVEGTRLIKSKYSEIKIIILTTFSDDIHISKALQYGASGYVLKDIKPLELILTIKSVARGLGIIHQNVFSNVVRQFNPPEETYTPSTVNEYGELSEKEIRIIRMIVDGQNNREIAELLYLSEGSVKNAVSAILTKLNLKDRTQLAVFAVKNNLV
ncbi:MAG: response regulator transcription factor [Clostridia bacterium]|nr:response regulator transcription factor [Clostridia bacterium]